MTYDIGLPNPKQKLFFESRARFTAYGGARGGGKSWAVRKKAVLLALRYPGMRILIVRRTLPELLNNHIRPLLAELKGIARYKDGDKCFIFANGSLILFGYCDTASDLDRYQGQEYDTVFLDEATQFTEWQFRALSACLRGTSPVPRRFYLTCNPGGIGHAWVKRLFILRQFEPGEHPEDYLFIPAGIYDNQALLRNDPDYLKNLQALPAQKRSAWLDGSWDVPEGQFFPEFRRHTHVCAPFALPGQASLYFCMDYGLDMLAGYWAAILPDGSCVIYRELFAPGLLMSAAAAQVRRLTGSERILAQYAPPDLWNRRQDTGRSVAEAFAAEGLALTRVSNNRAMGWLELREWLNTQNNGLPRLRVFDTCPHLIESLENLQCDPRNPGDCLNEPHIFTHSCDALRYLVSGRPTAAPALPLLQRAQKEEYELNSFITFGR